MTREEAIKLVKRIKGAIVYTEEEKEALETLIPELRESEDERIRKVIYKLMLGMREEIFTSQDEIVTKEKVLAYLEKQKESLHISETCKENADSFTDVDEAAEKSAALYYADGGYSPFPNIETAAHKAGFKAGAEWHKSKMLEGAVEGVVGKDGILTLSNGEAVDLCPSLDKLALGLKPDDKIRIVVLKAEEE